MTIGFDPNILLGWYQAKSNLASAMAGGSALAQGAAAAKIPTAPWNNPAAAPKDGTLVTQALAGAPFINERAAKVDVPTADPDYKRLFAINSGLLSLQALANAAKDSSTSRFELPAIQQAFQRGLSEITAYVQATKFDEFRLTPGIATSNEQTSTGAPDPQSTYTTPVLMTGSSADAVPAFQGTVQFAANVKKANGTVVTVNFDLSQMGSTTRSMSNVAAYMNSQLQAAGVGVRVSTTMSQTAPQTVTVAGVTTTIAPAQTQWAFSINGLQTEQVTFSAPTTQAAVYVAQAAGDPALPAPPPSPTSGSTTTSTPTTVNDQQQQVLKLEAGGGPDAAVRPGESPYTPGEVFGEKLPDGVGAVHASTVGADGSVYLLADATGTVNGQQIKGPQDAVLLKYDSAGTLVYTRTLGAAQSASGMSLAVSATGQVAIAGSVTGELDNGDSGANPTQSDSFVTVFDNQGQELWTQRQGSDTGNDTAKAVAFDASGNVYVAGDTQGSIGGGTSVGGQDGYLRAYSSTGVALSAQQFGTTGTDSVAGIVVSGSTVYVAGQDGAQATVRSIDATNPRQMAITATRSLGSGTINGIGLDGSGNLLIGGSTGGALTVGNVTAASSGGIDAFGAQISTNLTSTASDAVAYYGGSGTDQVTAATVAGGQVWVTGTTNSSTLGGQSSLGKQDGFVAALSVGTGAVTYSQRFTAKDSIDAPETIAVDATGGSALDKLGLPKGTVGFDTSQLVTSATSARAGDSFQIKVGNGPASTITIAADDTFSTLASKIRSAGLFEVNVGTFDNGQQTQITLKADSDRVTFQLIAGPQGRDALSALGLQAALVRNTIVDKTKGVIPADKGTQTYGLHLPSTLDLNSSADIGKALSSLTNAITTVRAIYADLRQAAAPKTASTAGGTVPAYLQNQIADYQAALDRLTAGQSASSGSSLVSLFG